MNVILVDNFKKYFITGTNNVSIYSAAVRKGTRLIPSFSIAALMCFMFLKGVPVVLKICIYNRI